MQKQPSPKTTLDALLGWEGDHYTTAWETIDQGARLTKFSPKANARQGVPHRGRDGLRNAPKRATPHVSKAAYRGRERPLVCEEIFRIRSVRARYVLTRPAVKKVCLVRRSTSFAIVSCTSFLLSACSSAPQGNSSPLPLAGSSANATRVRPHFNDAAYVKVHFHNGWDVRITARTEWSYVIFPIYFLAEERCVLPNQEWTSEIGFQYPNGEVAVTADRDNCVGHKNTHDRGLVFSSIQYTHADPARATITTDVRDDRRFGFSLCGRQTYPTMGVLTCDHR